MRTLFIIIVIGALGYLGWVYREELTGKIETATGAAATPAPVEASDAPAQAPDQSTAPAATPMPKVLAPTGSFYVRERTSVETPTGIKALNAGELVKLMYRNKDGTARVTTGKEDLTVKESVLTNDPEEIKH